MKVRIFIFLFFLSIFFPLRAQQKNKVSYRGRWASGSSEAIFRRGGFTFVGNGAYLEVYRNRSGLYEFQHSVLMPAKINDIWVKDDTTTVFAACGKMGLQIAYFDRKERQFQQNQAGEWIIGEYEDLGYATGVEQFGNYAYVTCGDDGLAIFNVGVASHVVPRGTYKTPGYAHSLAVINDYTVLVAVDSAGLYSIRIVDKDNPTVRTITTFDTPFNEKTARVYDVVVIQDTLAFVAAGWGGMHTLNVSNVNNLVKMDSWIETVPLEFMGIAVSNTSAFLTCGDEGFYGPIDVSDPSNIPDVFAFERINTDGFANAIVVDGDTAYVSDGFNGHHLIEVREAFQPQILQTIETADVTYDVSISGNYAYTSAGKAGIKVFDLVDPDNFMTPTGYYDTPGEAYAAVRQGSRIYIADGVEGLRVLNASSIENLTNAGRLTFPGDICDDISVPAGSYAYLACGTSGVRSINISNTIFEIEGGLMDTPGTVKAVHAADNRVYIADSSGIFIYDVSTLPFSVSQLASYTQGELYTTGIDVSGYDVFVSNGPYGFLVWNWLTGSIQRHETGGFIEDIVVKEKTLYLADTEQGLRIFDFSFPGEFLEVGWYNTGGQPRAVDIVDATVCVADGDDGLYVLESLIQPEILISQTNLNFGPVAKDHSRPIILWIKNVGTTLLNINDIESNEAAFVFSETSFSISPEYTHKLIAWFEPTADHIGDVVGSANIYTNAGTVNLTLQGKGVSLVSEGEYETDDFTIGLWHLNESEGESIVLDETSNQFDGLVMGTSANTGGSVAMYGKSVHCQGAAGWIEIPYDDKFNFRDTTFTVEMWFYMTEKPSNKYILARRGDYSSDIYQDSRQFELVIDKMENWGVSATVWDENFTSYSVHTNNYNQLNLNQWYHVAMTWDTDSLRIYMNSVLRDQIHIPKTIRNETTKPLAFGASARGEVPFRGYIDEIQVSSVARQSWEFRVNKSRLVIKTDEVDFGTVMLNQVRTLPFVVKNGGKQALHIDDIRILPSRNDLSINFKNEFDLLVDSDTTLWLQYTPKIEGSLLGEVSVRIKSSDPTYPYFYVPLQGEAVVNLPVGEYSSDPFTLGLYHFDEATASKTIIDSSGYNMHGVWHGSNRVSGKFEKALSFNGLTDMGYIKPQSQHNIKPNWGGFSIEGWFYVQEIPQGRRVLIQRGSGTGSQFSITIEGNTITGRMYNDDRLPFSVSYAGVEIHQWFHLGMTMGEGQLNLYLNGDRVDDIDFTGELYIPNNDTLSILLGRNWEGNEPFDGEMDEVRISGIRRQAWEFNVNMARMSVSLSSLDFGQVLINESRSLKLTILNTGIDTLYVTDVKANTPSNFFSDLTAFYIEPNIDYVHQQVINVTFHPTSINTVYDTLKFSTNDPYYKEKKFSVPIKGTGIPSKPWGAYESDDYTLVLYHCDRYEVIRQQNTGTVIDSSGNELDGILHNNVGWTELGVFGGALTFDGYNDWVEIPYDNLFEQMNDDFTVEFWFNMFSVTKEKMVLGGRGMSGNQQIEIALSNTSGLVATVWNSQGEATKLSTGSLSDFQINQWYHITFSWDGSTLRLYVNKNLKDEETFDGDFRDAATSSIHIGATPSLTYRFYGMIDEFRLSSIRRRTWELNVLPQAIEVYPTQLVFTNVRANTSETVSFWIMNRGDQALSVYSISGATGNFDISDDLNTFVLERNQSKEIPVSYRPTIGALDQTRVITVSSNDPNTPSIQVSAQGTGTESYMNNPPSIDINTLAMYHMDQALTSDTLEGATQELPDAYLRNGVRWTSKGFFNGGLLFDGQNDYMEILYNPDYSFSLGSMSFTIECYFKTDTVHQTLFAMGFAGSNQKINFGVYLDNEGKIQAEGQVADGFWEREETSYNDNKWHLAAFTFNHITQISRIYVDGEEVWSCLRRTRDFTNVTRSILFGASESDENSEYRHFDGTIDEIRISNVIRSDWEFTFSDYGITVLTTDPEDPVFGEDITFPIQIPGVLAPRNDRVLLYYRPGGGGNYRSKSATPVGSNYEVKLTSSDITQSGNVQDISGLEYYIEVVTQSNDTLTYPALDPVNGPVVQTLRHTGMLAPVMFNHKRFKMFSVPFVLEQVSVEQVIADDLGTYDPWQWRMFWWHNRDTTYVDYSPATTEFFRFVPGRAYWMTTNGNQNFTIGSGRTISTDENYPVSIYRGFRDQSKTQFEIVPGWNMIGNPFNFPVRWEDCVLSSKKVVNSLYHYDGEGFVGDYETLEPWQGYFICNQDTASATLWVPPRNATTISNLEKSNRSVSPVLKDLAEMEWLIHLSASVENASDNYNYAGVRINAAHEQDGRDRPEPPPVVNGYVTMHFFNSDWKIHPGNYCVDIRPVGEKGYIWNLRIQTDFTDGAITLAWNRVHELPEGWEAYLIDPDGKVSYNLLELTNTKIQVDENGTKLMRLLVGSNEFVNEQSNGVPLIPNVYALSQNYPNPFNIETTIHYSLPQQSDVEMFIYNSLGQRVRKILQKTQDAGYHEVIWDGRNDFGKIVSSGIYICKIKAGSFSKSRKMILVK